MKRLVVFLLSAGLSLTLLAAPAFPTGVSKERLRTEVLWDTVRQWPVGKRPRIVLVLGGGGARGLSHIGVLRVLEQEHIPVDQVIGVSVGALIGSLYSAGLSVDKIESMASDIGWENLTDFSRVRVLKLIMSDELLSTTRMENYLHQYIGDKTFADLKIPFACVATDLRTGEKVVFKEGPVVLAARASATLPGVFAPVPYRQRSLVDGGLVDNLPTTLIPGTKNDFIIGVLPKIGDDLGDVDNVLKALVRSIEIQRDSQMAEKRKTADWMIEPNVGSVSMVDLGKSKECMEAGLLAAREQALALKEAILKRVIK